MSCCYPKAVRVRTRRLYQQMARSSSRRVGHWLIIDFSPSKEQGTRLGITVSRHYGNAVKRNRFKRIVREAFRLCRLQLPHGLDLNIKPRNAVQEARSTDIIAEMLSLLK